MLRKFLSGLSHSWLELRFSVVRVASGSFCVAGDMKAADFFRIIAAMNLAGLQVAGLGPFRFGNVANRRCWLVFPYPALYFKIEPGASSVP